MLRAQNREPGVISVFLLVTHCALKVDPRERQP